MPRPARADGAPLFSLLAALPNNGRLIELVSENVTSSRRDDFRLGWPDAEDGGQPTASFW